MSTTGVAGCLPLTARSRSSPESPGILMSDTTRSNGCSLIKVRACSAAAAWVTVHPFAEKAETRKRRSDALSSTTRTRNTSGATVLGETAGMGTGRLLLGRRHLAEELHPLARQHAIVRELQTLEALGQRR